MLLLDVLQCIQTIDKLLNTAMNFRKSKKITYTKKKEEKKNDGVWNEKNTIQIHWYKFIFDYVQSQSDLQLNKLILLYSFYFQKLPDNFSCSKWLMKTWTLHQFIIWTHRLYHSATSSLFLHLLIFVDIDNKFIAFIIFNFLCSYDSINLLTI